MNKVNIIIGIILLMFVVGMTVPVFEVQAQSFGSISGNLDELAARDDVNIQKRPLAEIIGYIIYGILSLLGLVTLLLVLYAGISWMLADGNEQKIHDARNILKGAIIGIIIIALAFSVTTYVVRRVIGATERGAVELSPRATPDELEGEIRGESGGCRVIECSNFTTRGSCEANMICCFWESLGPDKGTCYTR